MSVFHCGSFFVFEGVGQKIRLARKWGEVGSQKCRKFFKMKFTVSMLHMLKQVTHPTHDHTPLPARRRIMLHLMQSKNIVPDTESLAATTC